MTDPYPIVGSDLDVVTRTLWGEARGEPHPDGPVAVAWVVRNRAAAARAYCWDAKRTRHPLYGDGRAASACLAPWQFSCWNENDPNREKLLAVDEHDPMFVTLHEIATDVFAGKIPSPVKDATHYVRIEMVPQTSWATNAERVATIGHHAFFRAVL